MKNLALFFSFIMIVSLSACAMQEDVLILNDKINRMNRRTTEIYQEINLLQEQLAKTRDELNNIDVVKSVDVISKKQANMGIELENIKAELMRLQGCMEQQENLWREQTSRNELEGKELAEKIKKLSEQLDQLQTKATRLKKVKLPADKPVEKEAATQVPATEDGPALTAEKNKIKAIKAEKTVEKEYEEAYRLYQERAYQQAKDKFRNFLNKYPDSALAGNARFWLGDCYYRRERYEEAILEYEKVIRKHKGPKVPAAILKQGLAFYHLGDPETAKLLMEKLIEEYPKSEQAEAGRVYLEKWGKD